MFLKPTLEQLSNWKCLHTEKASFPTSSMTSPQHDVSRSQLCDSLTVVPDELYPPSWYLLLDWLTHIRMRRRMWRCYRLQRCGDISNILVGTKTGCNSQKVFSRTICEQNRLFFSREVSRTTASFFSWTPWCFLCLTKRFLCKQSTVTRGKVNFLPLTLQHTEKWLELICGFADVIFDAPNSES